MKSVQMRAMDISNKVYDINRTVDALMDVVVHGSDLKKGAIAGDVDCNIPPILDIMAHTDKMCDDVCHKLCRLMDMLIGEGTAVEELTMEAVQIKRR